MWIFYFSAHSSTQWDRTEEMFRETSVMLADKVEEWIRLTGATTGSDTFCSRSTAVQMPASQWLVTWHAVLTTCWKVCMVGSRFTHSAEGNYYPTEGKLLAEADALHKTMYLTLGCPKLLEGTDQKPLLGRACWKSKKTDFYQTSRASHGCSQK